MSRTRSGKFGRTMLHGVALSALAASLGSCVMEQTVTDGSGEVIYQKPVVDNPFESQQKKDEKIEQNERALGW